MKRNFFYFLAAAILTAGCRDDTDVDTVVPEPVPVIFTLIDADVSDMPSDYSLNARLPDGELFVEENYFVDPQTNQFALNHGSFSVNYSREVIRESRINQQAMCVSGRGFTQCENQERPIASLWTWTGSLESADTLVWEYVDGEDPTRGYRWVMTERPQMIRVLESPSVLRRGQAQTITYEKTSATDSIWLELITIAKNELFAERSVPLIPQSRAHFYTLPSYEKNLITLSGDNLVKLFEHRVISPETDTAFWNIASIRRVTKVINGRMMQLTYQVNNLRPVRLEEE